MCLLAPLFVGTVCNDLQRSTKDDVVCDPNMHLRVSGLVGEVEEAGRRGVDDVGDAQPPGVLPPEKLELLLLYRQKVA